MTAMADTGVAIDATNFPDPVFRQYISENFDIVKDGVLSADEISKVEVVNVSNIDSLTSLEGIKKFTNLERLAFSPDLESLDVSGMTSLQELYGGPSLVSSINVSGCTNLLILECNYCEYTSLDVSSCTNIKQVSCQCCQLSSLNVSGCTKLEVLICADNNINSLDLRGLSKLQTLVVVANPMKNIDISASDFLCEAYLGNCETCTYPYYRSQDECFYFQYEYETY